jgi:hypothetical protein
MSKQMTNFWNGQGSWVESGGRGQGLGNWEARGHSRKRKRGWLKRGGSKSKRGENWQTKAALGSGDGARDAGNRGKGRGLDHRDVPVLGTDHR